MMLTSSPCVEDTWWQVAQTTCWTY